MYHRIADSEADPWQLAVHPKNFEQHLQILKNYGQVISLEELELGLQKRKIINKSIVITFDDGYLDNYTIAKPLLEKYKLPATFFITTKNIGTKELFWWDYLQILVFSSNLPQKFDLLDYDQTITFDLVDEAVLTPELKLKYKNFSAYEEPKTIRAKSYYQLWEILQSKHDAEKVAIINKLKIWAGFNKKETQDFVCMSENQIRSIAANDLFTIGGHTSNHPVLSNLKKVEQSKEILDNKGYLENLTNKPIKYFAYPSGKYNQATLECVQENGFNLAVTTNHQITDKKSKHLQLGRFQVDNLERKAFQKTLENWFK